MIYLRHLNLPSKGVANVPAFHGLEAAGFTRTDASGQPYGGWQAQERLTREAAWWAYTQGAAYAGFAEAQFGRLAPGQYADFIVVSGGDPLLLSPSELRRMKVEQTWIGGVVAWERK